MRQGGGQRWSHLQGISLWLISWGWWLPWRSSKDSALSLQRAQVQSLVKELRFHMPHDMALKKKKVASHEDLISPGHLQSSCVINKVWVRSVPHAILNNSQVGDPSPVLPLRKHFENRWIYSGWQKWSGYQYKIPWKHFIHLVCIQLNCGLRNSSEREWLQMDIEK